MLIYMASAHEILAQNNNTKKNPKKTRHWFSDPLDDLMRVPNIADLCQWNFIKSIFRKHCLVGNPALPPAPPQLPTQPHPHTQQVGRKYVKRYYNLAVQQCK